MRTDTENVPQSKGASRLPNPRTGLRAAAMGGGGVEPALALNVAPEPKGNALAGDRRGWPWVGRGGHRTALHYDSLADAMQSPRPTELPPIFSVPVVTNAQRRRLKRAIESYRDEA